MKNLTNLLGTMFSSIVAIAACPSCLPALASLVSSLGIWPLFQLKYVQPFGIVALAGLIYSWRRHRNFIPLLGGLISIVWLYVALFVEFYTILYWQVWLPTTLLFFFTGLNLYFEKKGADCKIKT